MSEELLEAEVVEEETEPIGDGDAPPAISRLPEPRASSELAPAVGEVRTVALAAAGGIVAGAATVAAVRAVRAGAARTSRTGRRRVQRRPMNVLASRSFLVDVHLLGK